MVLGVLDSYILGEDCLYYVNTFIKSDCGDPAWALVWALEQVFQHFLIMIGFGNMVSQRAHSISLSNYSVADVQVNDGFRKDRTASPDEQGRLSKVSGI